MRAMAALWLDTVLSVKVVHRIEPRTEPTGWDNDVDVVWEHALGLTCFELAFIAGH